MNPSGDDRTRQIQSLIQEFLEQYPEPTAEHEESLCSQHPDLAPLLHDLLPRVRGLTAAQTREQIERLITHDTQVAEATLVAGEEQPAPDKPWVPGADTVADATLPAESAKPLFDSRYRVVRTIGKGGFGRVDLVEDTLRRNERVALKVILPKHADTKEFELRFQNEISVLRALQHEGIPQIFNDGLTSEGEFYFTMEFVKGISLEDVLEREKRLGPRRIVRLVRQITDTLEYAHSRGVVHRDLKPNNIVLINEGTDDEQAKVLDFGIAKILKKEGMLEYAETMDTLAGMGTPHYMSPEQVRGKGIDGSTDFYALGIIIYRMVSSRFPFKGKTPMEIATTRIEHDAPPLEVDQKSASELTTQLSTLVKALLEREKEKRPGAEQIRRHLVLEGMAREQRRFHRFGRRVAAFTAAAALVVAAYFLWPGTSGPGPDPGPGPDLGSGPGPGPIVVPPGPGAFAALTPINAPVSRPFMLAGVAKNLATVRVVWSDGERDLAVDADGNFTGDLELPDGTHTLNVVDPATPEESFGEIEVTVDGTPPALAFDAIPGIAVEKDGETLYYVREPSIEIRGSVSDAGPSGLTDLKANSNPIELDTDGGFSYSLFEDVGTSDQSGAAVFVARDGARNEATHRLVFMYDGAPPEIRFELGAERWSGGRTLEIAEEEVRLTAEIVDSHALALFLDDEELATQDGKAAVTLAVGDDDEPTYLFRATDVSGRESTAELSFSRKLALVAVAVDGDSSALEAGTLATPRESIVLSGSLNRPAESVRVAYGSAAPVEASLTPGGTGFEITVALAEGAAQALRIFLDGTEVDAYEVSWEPPNAPAGLVRLGNEGVDGRAKYAKHEATGMQFVLVPAPEKPYAYGDVQVALDGPYYIGTTEVTRSQFEASGLEYEDQRFWTKIDDPSLHAMVGVTFETAKRYCDWLDVDAGTVRLPSEAEWLHAAGGAETPDYPWGGGWDAALCHSRDAGERNPIAVTVHQATTSWSGASGFAGNVSEWCTRTDGSAVLRGGSWASGAEDCKLTERPAFRGEGGKNTVGFRVVIVPE